MVFNLILTKDEEMSQADWSEYTWDTKELIDIKYLNKQFFSGSTFGVAPVQIVAFTFETTEDTAELRKDLEAVREEYKGNMTIFQCEELC